MTNTWVSQKFSWGFPLMKMYENPSIESIMYFLVIRCCWRHAKVLHSNLYREFFFKEVSFFSGATDTTVFDFWCLLWVSKPEWAALFAFGRSVRVTHSMRFASYATHIDPFHGQNWNRADLFRKGN